MMTIIGIIMNLDDDNKNDIDGDKNNNNNKQIAMQKV